MSKKKTLFFSSQEAVALGVPLIMEVDTTDTSSAVSASDSIILPFDEGNTVNLQIDWGDGTALEPYTDTNNICSHQYSSGGFYDIKIYNLNGVSRIPWNITNVATNRKDFSKFYDLKQFGDCEIYQLDEFDAGSFKECTNLDVTATDLGGRCVELCVNAFELFRDTSIVEAKNSANWDVSNVISFRSLVDTNTNIIIDCSNWEMSQADNIQGVFARCGNINPDVTNWDITNNCNNMQSAFLLLSNFERDLSNWDVSGVTNMQSTFSSCTSFTGQGLDTWVTSALINLQSTFFNCTNFNGNLQNFDVSGVTTMNSAFEQCTNFLGNGVDSWVTSSVLTDLRDCFDEARNFDADLSNWDVTGVTNMFQTFRLNNKFKGDGLENWVTSSLTNMYRTFDGALQFNADLSNWDATNVTNMESAFRGCSIFEGIGMNNWTTSSSLSNMANAFQSAPQFNGNLQGFNVSGVTRLEFCFFNSTSFEGGGLDTWVTSSLVNLRNTFDNTNFNQDLSGWDFSNVTDMTNWGNAWAMDTNNYDLLLLSLSTQSLNSNLSNVRMSSKYTAGEVTNGVTDGVATNKLIDSTQNFTSTVNVGDIIKKASNYAEVVTVDSNTELTLDLDIMALGDSYSVEGSNVAKARYFVVKTYNWQIIDNGQAPAANTFIGGVGATLSTPTLVADKLNGFNNTITEQDISLFSVDGNNNISFRIELDYLVSNFGLDSDLTYWRDTGGFFKAIENGAFGNASLLEYIYMPNGERVNGSASGSLNDTVSLKFIYAPKGFIVGNPDNMLKNSSIKYCDYPKITDWLSDRFYAWRNCDNLKYIKLNETQVLGRRMWWECNSIRRIYLPSVNTQQSDSFNNIDSSFCKVYVPIGFVGSSDTAAVNFQEILNTNSPNTIVNLSESNITSTTVDLNFTPPTSTNALDFYEVWIENLHLDIWDSERKLQQLQFDNEITNSGDTITGLLPNTTYRIRIVACDIYWNRSEFSNEITITTL